MISMSTSPNTLAKAPVKKNSPLKRLMIHVVFQGGLLNFDQSQSMWPPEVTPKEKEQSKITVDVKDLAIPAHLAKNKRTREPDQLDLGKIKVEMEKLFKSLKKNRNSRLKQCVAKSKDGLVPI